MQHLQSALGIFALLAFAFLISENSRAVDWKSVGIAFAVTVATAVLLLEVPQLKVVFAVVGRAADAIGGATRAGTSLVFGYLGGGALPFDLKTPGADFVLAFQALPIVLVMSVLTTLLFHWRILPPIVRGFSWLLERTMGVGGAVGLSTAANIFLGMVESPLFIKPYLARLTRGELFMVMTGGMAGIAGTVFVLYATVLRTAIPDVAGHLLVASIVSAPGALLISMLMVPDKPAERTDMGAVEVGAIADSTMDAIVRGTAAGLELLLNIVAMLIVLVALVALANAILSLLPDVAGAAITLQRLLGLVMAPVCWLMGIPWDQALIAGSLMGTKTVLNELIAYLDLARLPANALDARSRLIMLYAMCGFANFGSLGIMIAGLTVMAPERRADIVSLGPKTIVSGTLTTCLMGAIVGVLN
jgi:CNT family concentrative nucleoside transporter